MPPLAQPELSPSLALVAALAQPVKSTVSLSEKQQVALQLVANGKAHKEIAQLLDTTEASIGVMLMTARRRNGCASTPELVAKALRAGEIR